MKHFITGFILCLCTLLCKGQERLIILNEGNWQSNNARISYFEDGVVVSNKWFEEKNGYGIGDTPNDIIQVGSNLIAIAINWSNIIQDTTEINLENVAFPTNYETATVTMNTSIVSSKTPTITVKVGTADATNIVITNNAPLSLTFDLPANLAEGTHNVTLYITNLAKSYTKQNAIGIYKPMQEMTPELCESMTLEEQKQFLDTRDNKI